MPLIALPPASLWTLDAGLQVIPGDIGIELASGGNYQALVMANAGLVAYWKMDSDWTDSKGTNHGTAYGGATFGVAKYGLASGSFDGAGDYVAIGDVELVTGNTLTIEAWIKTPSITQYAGIVEKAYSGTAYHFGGDYAGSTGKVQFHVNNSANYALSNASLADNQWHHIVGVYDGSTVKLYVDSVLQTKTGNQTGNVNNVADKLAIGAQVGASASAFYFLGSIDEVAIYNTALSLATIQDHYNAVAYPTTSPTATSPWFRIDQNTLDAATSVAIIEHAIAGLFGASSGNLKYQYALNAGSLNGTWLTLAQLLTALNGATISNHTSSMQLKVQFNSDGTQRCDASGFGSYVTAAGITEAAGDCGYPAVTSTLVTGLEAYLRMDEAEWTGVAGEVIDSSGNANHGTAYNGATTAAGKLGLAGEFAPASNTYVEIADDAALRLVSGGTLAAWVKQTSYGEANTGRVIDKAGGGVNGWSFYPGASGVRLWVGNVGEVRGSVLFGVWTHIAATFSGTVGKVYINGVQVGADITVAVPADVSGVVQIGKWTLSSARQFDGLIDEVGVWSRVLSATEILQLYNEGRGLILPVAREIPGRFRGRLEAKGGLR